MHECAGVNTVLKSVRLGTDTAILVNDHTYGAVVYACESVCARTGSRLVSANIRQPREPGDKTLTADEIVETFERVFAANPDIRIALFGMITALITYCNLFASQMASAIVDKPLIGSLVLLPIGILLWLLRSREVSRTLHVMTYSV